MKKSYYFVILGIIIINGVHAHNYQHPPDEGSSPISKDPISSRYGPSPKIPGIQDYPNLNDRMLLNSIIHSSVLNNDSLASPLDLHRLFNCPIIRKARATSANSQEFLDHVSIIARIANGISLQSGLMNDKINIVDVAGELLNFGDVPVSKIAKFKPDSLNKFTEKLKAILTTLDSSVRDQETQLLKWFELRKSSQTIGDVANLPGKDEYFSFLKSLSSTDFDLVVAPSQHMKNAKGEISKLKSTNLAADSIVRTFLELSASFKHFRNSIEPFKASLEKLKNSELQKGLAVYMPIEKSIELISKRDKFSTTLRDDGKTTIVSNLKSINTLSDDSKGSIQDVNTLTSLSETKSDPKFQKRKVTSGSPNGVSDLKQLARDVRNPWIAKILGTNGSLDSLNDGLLPLFKMNKKLNELDEKLGILSTPKLPEALSGIQTLQRELSEVDPKVHEMTESAWADLEKCGSGSKVEYSKFAQIQDVIRDVKSLTQISQSKLEEKSFKEFDTKLDKFIQNLGFTDLNNQSQSIIEAPTIMKRLKDEKKFDEIENTVNGLIGMFADVKGLEQKVGDVISKQNTPLPQSITDELRLYQCLQNLQNTDKVAQAITVAQNLRGRKNDDLTAVESAIKDVSGASKDLSNLGSLTADMKKHPDVAPTNLNKFSNSAAQSNVIGQSATSLRFAHDLKELDPEISHLKNVGDLVEKEIQKLSDPAQIKDLTAQWGNHTSDMGSLDQTLSGILSFESTLSVSKAKTLEEFSSPLKNLGTIPDAKINSLEKSKVLEALIAQPNINPTIKSDLEKSKQTLDKLAPLDLEFSSHQSQFEKAPGAFKALHDFLVGFFTVKQKVIPSGPNNGNSSAPSSSKVVSEPTENSDHTTIYIVFGVLGFFLLAASIGGGIWAFFWRRKKNKEEAKRLEEEEKEKKRQEKEKEKEKADREKEDKERAERDKKEAARLKELEWLKDAAKTEAACERKQNEVLTRQRKEQMDKVKEQYDIDMAAMLSGVEKWVKSHKYTNANQLASILGDQMKIVVNYHKQNFNDLRDASWAYLPIEKHRYPNGIPCLLETVVKFKFNDVDRKIHANHVVTKPTYSKHSQVGDAKVSMRFIATQGPLPNTLNDFWAMVWHFEVKYIIMLCGFKENGNVKCDVYFKEDGLGTFETTLFKIETVSKEPIFEGRPEAGYKRKFEVVYKKDPKEEKRTLTHYHYLAWPDKGVPDGHEDVRQLLEFVKYSEAPVVVHCSAGIGRTMCLIGTEYMAAEVKNNGNYTVAQGGIDLRNVRSSGIQTFEQMVWLVASVVYRLTRQFNLDKKYYESLVKQIEKGQKQIFKKDLELKLKYTCDFREGDMSEDSLKLAIEREQLEERKEEEKKQRKKGGKDTRIVMDVEGDGEEVAGPGMEVVELDSDEEEENWESDSHPFEKEIIFS
ncbi:hypothetical protein B9Z55_015991 [Caenorhabditis nigoni]|uniref:Protein-tyrosine-phosphatase n=1 Tax=Caenorhabditis nigoni TaxID=1611254 RepID=A0A2G5UCP9_9PELO|nr:hypothetical protein B9Z55_015991 [Caenorhabditis nigoni]